MTIPNQYRQGDVLFEEIQNLPPRLKKLAHCVIAEGEATGHKHEVADVGAAVQYENEDGTVRFLEVLKSTSVVHPEHGPISLAPGNYRVVYQREYEPSAVRRVKD